MNLKLVARKVYSNKEIRELLYNFFSHREVMVRTAQNKVIRPAPVINEADIMALVNIGAISFHASIDKYDQERIGEGTYNIVGRDLVVDIDIKYLPKDLGYEHPYELAKEIVKVMYDHVLSRMHCKSLWIKYSGNRGFHIVIPYEEIPKTILGLPFNEYALVFHRSLLLLLKYIAYSYLEDSVLMDTRETVTSEDIVDIDLQIASPRHMIRAPYSVHEKTGLVSVVVPIKGLMSFDIESAKPPIDEIIPLPSEYIENNEFIEDILVYTFIVSSSEFRLENVFRELSLKKLAKKIRTRHAYYRKKLSKINYEDIYPPCVRRMLEGLEDGRKRSLFHLTTFFKAIGLPADEVLLKLKEWNQKNKEPLSDKMIEYTVKYHYDENRKYLPYSCQRIKEEFGDTICKPDKYCKLYQVKHPLSYFYKRLRDILSENEGQKHK